MSHGGPATGTGIGLRTALLALLAGLALWQGIVWLTGVPRFILPGPARVAGALLEHHALILQHALVTATEVLAGLLIGAALGVVSGLALMLSEPLRRALMPVMLASQAIPVFALAPVLTLWLGYGMAAKVVMAVLIIYFPVASNFLDGLRRTDTGLLDLAHTMQARPLRVLFLLRLPAALPALASGLRLAAVYAPIGAVIGEWVGASQGLGYLMLLANGRAKIDLMFAAVGVLALFTLLLHAGIGVLAAWLTRRAGQAEH